MKTRIKFAMVSAVALAAGLSPASAFAQQDRVAAEEAADGDIIVTARKREESLQEVPLSVTAFSGADLEKKGVSNFNDLSVSNPNVKITAQSGVPTIASSVAIRGNIQGTGTLVVDPSVGAYVDGLLLAHTMGTAQLTVDVESVQTLKGPQGTLFGRNTTGGALLIKTRDPELGDVSGYVQADVGGIKTRRFGGAINVPVGEIAALRVVYQNNSRGNYQTLADGRSIGDKDEEILRAKLLVQPAEGTRLILLAEKLKESATGTANVVTQPNAPVYNNTPVTTISVGKSPSTPQTNGEHAEVEAEYYGLRFEQDAGEGMVKFMAHRREYDILSAVTLPPLFGWSFQDKPDNSDTSFELQYTGTLLNDRLDIAAGLYYFDETVHEVQNTFYYVLGVQRGSRNVELQSKSKSAYVQGTFKATDQLNFTLGGRYTKDKKNSVLYSATSNFNPANAGAGQTVLGTQAAAYANPAAYWSQKNSKFNYLVSVDFEPADDILLYASHSTGYRAGGSGVDRASENPLNAGYDDITGFDPENIKNFEAGFKTQFLDRMLTLNGAAFYQDYGNYQFQTVNAAVIRETLNVDAKIKGFELDTRLALPTGTTLSADVGYVNAKMKGKPAGSTFLEDQALPYIPTWTWSVSLNQSFELGGGDLDLNATYSWRDNFWTQAENAATSYSEIADSNIESLGLLNVSATYVNGPWNLSVYANNLTDEKYYTFLTRSGNGASLRYAGLGLPRIIGARVRYSF